MLHTTPQVFMRREDGLSRDPKLQSPFRKFEVRCHQCGAYRLRLISEYDEDSGELRVFLSCTDCREREVMPIR